MKILVTGSAGFIGNAVALSLLTLGHDVVGVDALSDYYDVALKRARLERVSSFDRFRQLELDIADRASMETLFASEGFEAVVHMAAQAGVRYAADNPHAYASTNLVGFLNVLEGCRHHRIGHLVFASSSSVYGANAAMPFSEHSGTEHPITFYGATKKSNEMMAHSYAHLFGLPCTGLRFFTVYGPWGRPDMAPMLFARAISNDEALKLFNGGQHKRSFTYIDDVAEAVVRVVETPAMPDPQWDASAPDPASSSAPYRLFNVGNGDSIPLLRFVDALESSMGRVARRELLPIQPGDVPDTAAACADLEAEIGVSLRTPIEVGVPRFIEWYREYYSV